MSKQNRMQEAILVVLLGVCAWAISTAAETIALVAPDRGIVLVDTEEAAPWSKAGLDEQLVTGTITFNIGYDDLANQGFRDATLGAERRARLHEALTYIADVVNMTGELDVQVQASEFDGGGALAWGGTYYANTPGFNDGSSLVRLLTGTKPFAGFPEIVMQVDFGHNWNMSAGDPAAGEVDFLSVITHEITHGLGYASIVNASGGSKIAAGVFTVFDSLILRGSVATLLFGGTPPSLQRPVGDLTSGDLKFDGDAAFTQYGQGVRPGLYAPATFADGSSLQHWDSGNIVGGAVMEHIFLTGATKRLYAPVDIGALIDLGYADAAQPSGEGEGEGEGEGGGEGEGEGEPPACDLISVEITQPAADVYFDAPAATTTVPLRSVVTLDESAGCTLSPVEVVYTINGAEAGQSQDQAGSFPASAELGIGSYTLVATATTPVSKNTVTDQITFDVIRVEPHLTVTPNPAGGYAFGNVKLGSNAEQIFTVSNTGAGTLNGTVSITGDGFTLLGAVAYALGPDETDQTRVRFTPPAIGNYVGTVTFTGGENGPVAIGLSAAGIEAPGCNCQKADGAGLPNPGELFLTGLTLLVLAFSARWLRP